MATASHPSPAACRVALMVVVVVALGFTSVGCRSPAVTARTVEPADFEQHLIDREHISADEARCVSDQVFAAYDDASIRTISEHGVIALPSPRWAPYTYAMVECVMGDELLAPTSSDPMSSTPTSSSPPPPTSPGTER